MKALQTKDEFKTLVENIQTNTIGYKNPLIFGICSVENKQSDINYLIINNNKNFASAAVFIKVLQNQGNIIDFTKNELIFKIDLSFLKQGLNIFNPFLDNLDEHKNIQIISTLYNKIKNEEDLENIYKIVFIFNDITLLSDEAKLLKASIL